MPVFRYLMKSCAYLKDDKVNFVLDKWLELLPHLGLDGGLALALSIGGTLDDAARHQSVPFVCYFPG